VWLVTANGSGAKNFRRAFPVSSTLRTVSIFLRRGTNNFAQLCFSGDVTNFANYDLLTGTIGSLSDAVTSTMIPWRDGWYRCTMTYTSPTATGLFISIVSSSMAPRA
jgi:hypothetical protein